MAQQGFEEDLLRRWFPANAEKTLTPFNENDIREVADVLTRCARERWSRVPRLYSILRKIGQLDTIDSFIDSDITDVYFPFTKNTLPEALCDHSARLRFLELQHLVYNTEALRLERRARHGHFSDPTEVPLKKVGELGKGGYGYVDRVVSTISHQEYARKLIPRGRTFKKNKQVLRDFTKELSNLKRLCHKHLVELVGSYTDKRFVALIMLPVADTNLQSFMERPDLEERARSFLRPFFGCLTSALSYLHDNRIRHKDIKPSNILIKNDQVYFTDFGTSLDWSGRDNSVTETASPTTPRYCAPEVMAYIERNTASDIWSFGCVFLEMWTVLKYRTLKDLRAYMMTQGTGAEGYHSNLEAIASWIALLQQLPGPSSDLLPVDWILNMLQEKPVARWNIHTLDNRIGEASFESSAQHTFKGLCCLELEDETSEDSRLSDEDLESSIAPLPRSQNTSSCTGLNPNQADLIHGQAVVGDMFTNLVASKASEGFNESPCPPGLCSELEGLPPTNKNFERGAKELACEAADEAGRSSDQANGKIKLPVQTPCLLPRFDPSISDGEINLSNNGAPSSAKSSPSSGDESYASAPPYQSLSRDSVSLPGIQFESTQATNNQILCLRSSARWVDEHDADSKVSSPVVIKRMEAKIINNCSATVFPMSEPERKAACDFDRHARDCSDCYNPLGIYLGNRRLCEEGGAYAVLLLKHVCRFDGRVHQTTKCQYISQPNFFWPLFRAGPSPVRAIPLEYIQVRSLLKAVERSMIDRLSSLLKRNLWSLPEATTFWARLHMCVICKRPLGERGWNSLERALDTNVLSCSHEVHRHCRVEVDRLECRSERYCSWCPGAALVVGRGATTSTARHEKPKARRRRTQTQDALSEDRTEGTQPVADPRQLPYYHSRQSRTPIDPMYESVQYHGSPEAEIRYPLHPLRSHKNIEAQRRTPEYVPIYDPGPHSSRPRRADISQAFKPTPSAAGLYAASNPRRLWQDYQPPRGTPEYVPIYEPEPASSRPRRATTSSKQGGASNKSSRPLRDPRVSAKKVGDNGFIVEFGEANSSSLPSGPASRGAIPSQRHEENSSIAIERGHYPLPQAAGVDSAESSSYTESSSDADSEDSWDYIDEDNSPDTQNDTHNDTHTESAFSTAATCGHESQDEEIVRQPYPPFNPFASINPFAYVPQRRNSPWRQEQASLGPGTNRYGAVPASPLSRTALPQKPQIQRKRSIPFRVEREMQSEGTQSEDNSDASMVAQPSRPTPHPHRTTPNDNPLYKRTRDKPTPSPEYTLPNNHHTRTATSNGMYAPQYPTPPPGYMPYDHFRTTLPMSPGL
jgi:serine/threonine protein kinase